MIFASCRTTNPPKRTLQPGIWFLHGTNEFLTSVSKQVLAVLPGAKRINPKSNYLPNSVVPLSGCTITQRADQVGKSAADLTSSGYTVICDQPEDPNHSLTRRTWRAASLAGARGFSTVLVHSGLSTYNTPLSLVAFGVRYTGTPKKAPASLCYITKNDIKTHLKHVLQNHNGNSRSGTPPAASPGTMAVSHNFNATPDVEESAVMEAMLYNYLLTALGITASSDGAFLKPRGHYDHVISITGDQQGNAAASQIAKLMCFGFGKSPSKRPPPSQTEAMNYLTSPICADCSRSGNLLSSEMCGKCLDVLLQSMGHSQRKESPPSSPNVAPMDAELAPIHFDAPREPTLSSMWNDDASNTDSATAHGIVGSQLMSFGGAATLVNGAGLAGIKNSGNTCFMNAALQCLLHIKDFKEFFLTKFKPTDGKAPPLATSFADLMQQMWQPGSSKKPLSATALKSAFAKEFPNFAANIQQDGHEFLVLVLDLLHSQLKNTNTNQVFGPQESNGVTTDEQNWSSFKADNNSIIADTLYGQLQSQLTCKSCGKTSTTYDPFADLSLSIPPTQSPPVTLDDCLHLFTKPETLLDYRCLQCNKTATTTKTVTIHRPPKVLIIHIKRFRYYGDYNEGHCRKISTPVEFPKTDFDLKPFSTHALSSKPARFSGPYTLLGVINHVGGCSSGGHYTALINFKHPSSSPLLGSNNHQALPSSPSTKPKTEPAWYLFNDSFVTRDATAMSSSAVHGPLGVCSSAYLLVYERKRATE
eukprot:TRINITY_DN67408_c1_g1_i2.p1 TRINITY_DN67408_c1_g1~~TRINITY_DN67408_c1_g1_i2.p1  ORF type:complete len:758 (-),score=58.14 TRINITY_DN67408_c1_g1_i2:1130-3403(-)